MKNLRTLASGILILLVGVFLGREFFPREPPSPDTPSSSPIRSVEKSNNLIQTNTPPTSISSAGTTNLADLIVSGDPFQTSTHLRRALGDANYSDLEKHLNRLIGEPSSSNSHILKTSVLNHLIAIDPLRAFDFVVTHENKQLQNAYTSFVLKALARHDPKLARDSLSLINDPIQKQAAHLTLQQLGIDASPESLIAILKSAKRAGFQGPLFPNLSSPLGTTALIDHGDLDFSDQGNFGHHFSFNQLDDTYAGILQKLTQQDFASAEKYARSIQDKSERNRALSSIANGLALKDPKKALAWANSLDDSDDKEQHIRAVLSVISRQDPESAAGMLSTITNPGQQKTLIRDISTHWVRKNPEAAMTWLQSLPDTEAKASAYSSAINHLIQTDSPNVGSYLDNLPKSISVENIPRILSNWVGQDFDLAKHWITQQTDPRLLSISLTSLVPVWADKNPREVAVYLENSSLKPSENTSKLYRDVAEEWTSSDPEAALTWAQGIKSDSLKNSATNMIYQHWAMADPEGAAELLPATNSPKQRQQLLSSVAYWLARKDSAAGQEWLFSLSQNDRYQAARRLISAIESSHPTQAATIYDQLAAGTSDEDKMKWLHYGTSSIARNWSKQDPTSAAAWASKIPATQGRQNAIASVAGSWIEQDAETASRWIHQLPNDLGKDRATSLLVKHIEKIDPESAFDWALSINDPGVRSDTLASSLRAWHRFDAEATRAAIQSANLTDKERSSLLKRYQ